MASAPSPTAADARLTAPRSVRTSHALASGNGPEAVVPSRSASWPPTMFTATAVRNPVSTDTETKRT